MSENTISWGLQLSIKKSIVQIVRAKKMANKSNEKANDKTKLGRPFKDPGEKIMEIGKVGLRLIDIVSLDLIAAKYNMDRSWAFRYSIAKTADCEGLHSVARRKAGLAVEGIMEEKEAKEPLPVSVGV